MNCVVCGKEIENGVIIILEDGIAVDVCSDKICILLALMRSGIKCGYA